jgi:PhoPQ-activated pathogenicity-related protein
MPTAIATPCRSWLINSAGDQFFLPDSSHFYWDELPNPKSLRYTFNTDHRQADDTDEWSI